MFCFHTQWTCRMVITVCFYLYNYSQLEMMQYLNLVWLTNSVSIRFDNYQKSSKINLILARNWLEAGYCCNIRH